MKSLQSYIMESNYDSKEYVEKLAANIGIDFESSNDVEKNYKKYKISQSDSKKLIDNIAPIIDNIMDQIEGNLDDPEEFLHSTVENSIFDCIYSDENLLNELDKVIKNIKKQKPNSDPEGFVDAWWIAVVIADVAYEIDNNDYYGDGDDDDDNYYGDDDY